MQKIALPKTALAVLKKRYLLKNNKGKIIETPIKMFKRVAKIIASVDKKYKASQKQIKKTEKEFFSIISNFDFLPNSPTLMNAGTKLNQLSACFVLPVWDSMEGIFSALKSAAIIHQSGGGTGFGFSRLRQRGALISSTQEASSGAVSFMSIFNKATDIIKQGGKRRGANIGILRIDHPDIGEFIKAKSKRGFENFNLSVALTDKFIDAVKKNKGFSLISPQTKKSVKTINAKKLFNEIVNNAWEHGDPGIIFIDEINRKNPTPKLGKIESTNPCGEVPLLPYESCNLGSINLSNMVKEVKERCNVRKEIDFEKLRNIVHKAVHFLDNVIDANKYPLEEVDKATKLTRKIGLGVMGFADMLIKLGIPYNSETAIMAARDIMKFINNEARSASQNLAKKRGSFPAFNKSKLTKKYKKMRNTTVTTIAPTGSISIIAGCSSGIEPLFALMYKRKILGGEEFFEINPLFEKALKDYKINVKNVRETGIFPKNFPASLRKVFVTATEIKPEYHVRIQADFQKYTDNAVSKTVNLPNSATKQEIAKIFMLAYKLKCKGITVYRSGSKAGQVLEVCMNC